MSESIKYYVDPEKRTVVAVLTVEPDAMVEEVMSIFRKSFSDALLATGCTYNLKSFCLKGKYTGVASCHPDDEFNEEQGKRIARLKALKSYMKDRKVITDKIACAANSFVTRANDMHMHSISALNNINEALKK